jgi:precorrin-4 methylase
MRIPGVSVFCVAASLLGTQSPYPDLSGKRRIDRCKVQESVT